MKQRHSQTRQKMSRIIDELGAALFDVGAAAHRGVYIGEGMAEFGGHGVQNAHSFADDLGADAVAFDNGNRLTHFVASLSFREAIRPPLAIMSLINGGKGSA